MAETAVSGPNELELLLNGNTGVTTKKLAVAVGSRLLYPRAMDALKYRDY